MYARTRPPDLAAVPTGARLARDDRGRRAGVVQSLRRGPDRPHRVTGGPRGGGAGRRRRPDRVVGRALCRRRVPRRAGERGRCGPGRGRRGGDSGAHGCRRRAGGFVRRQSRPGRRRGSDTRRVPVLRPGGRRRTRLLSLVCRAASVGGRDVIAGGRPRRGRPRGDETGRANRSRSAPGSGRRKQSSDTPGAGTLSS